MVNIEVISEENEFVHVSGHPNRDDLKDMYTWVNPKCVIPVHGEHRHMIEHINFAKEMKIPNQVQVENGDIVKLFPGEKPSIYDKAPSGRLYLDGAISVDEDSQSIKDRKNLSGNGYMEVTILLTPKGNIHQKPILTFRGLPVQDTEDFIYGLEEEIESTAKTFSLNSKKQSRRLKGFDYGSEGAYLIKINTRKGKHLFGSLKNGKMLLNVFGEIAKEEWLNTLKIRKI